MTHPHLQNEWHPDNPPIETTSKGSVKHFKWLCKEGHTWEAPPYNRVRGSGCPYCSGYKAVQGKTDLLTLYPSIANEWSPRNPLGPENYTAMSGKKVWWSCEYNHEWESTIANRTSGGNRCPHCSVGSVPRIEIFLLCSFSRFGEVRHHHSVNQWTVDLYMPQKNLVIEYDGAYWHKDRKNQDTSKTEALLHEGLSVIRFREKGLPNLEINHPRFAAAGLAWAAGQDALNSSVDLALLSIDFFQA